MTGDLGVLGGVEYVTVITEVSVTVAVVPIAAYPPNNYSPLVFETPGVVRPWRGPGGLQIRLDPRNDVATGGRDVSSFTNTLSSQIYRHVPDSAEGAGAIWFLSLPANRRGLLASTPIEQEVQDLACFDIVLGTEEQHASIAGAHGPLWVQA